MLCLVLLLVDCSVVTFLSAACVSLLYIGLTVWLCN